MSLNPATSPSIRQTARPLSALLPERERNERGIDDRLATRLFYGDDDAAEALRLRHTDRLVDIALAIVLDEDEAVEIVEGAIDDACRGWPPTRGSVGRWLRDLVRRRARARVRGLSGPHASAFSSL
jgi:hypothetical protein